MKHCQLEKSLDPSVEVYICTVHTVHTQLLDSLVMCIDTCRFPLIDSPCVVYIHVFLIVDSPVWRALHMGIPGHSFTYVEECMYILYTYRFSLLHENNTCGEFVGSLISC